MPCHPLPRLGRRVGALVLAGLLAGLMLPATRASADAYQAVENAYATSPRQTIPTCEFTPAELAQAASSVPNDTQQYNGGLLAAIQQARQAQAEGACAADKQQGAGATVPVGTPAPPSAPRLGRGTPLPVGSATAATDAGLPAPLAILAALAALAVLAGAIFAFARLRGWNPPWLAPTRHSWDEAGYRVSGIWSDFGRRGRRAPR